MRATCSSETVFLRDFHPGNPGVFSFLEGGEREKREIPLGFQRVLPTSPPWKAILRANCSPEAVFLGDFHFGNPGVFSFEARESTKSRWDFPVSSRPARLRRPFCQQLFPSRLFSWGTFTQEIPGCFPYSKGRVREKREIPLGFPRVLPASPPWKAPLRANCSAEAVFLGDFHLGNPSVFSLLEGGTERKQTTQNK